MRCQRLGDGGFVLSDFEAPAYALAKAIRESAPKWLLDVYSSYETVGVYFRPGSVTEARLRELVEGLSLKPETSPRTHVIPVCYEIGEDLENVARQLGMPRERVAEVHCSRSYTCFAVGFCPGFPYLGYLPNDLCGIARLAEPRIRLEAGSVGITGKQTAVYPLPTPGGWAIIGRTPLEIVNVREHYFPISAGDEVQFRAIDRSEFAELKGARLAVDC